MTGEECEQLFRANKDLREYICTQARRHSRYPENQEDFIGEAWVYLMMAPSGRRVEYYKCIALRGIQAEYQRKRRKRIYHLSDEECMSRAEWNMWRHGPHVW